MTERDDDGFLSRWSKRKRDVQAGVAQDEAPENHDVALAVENEANLAPVDNTDAENAAETEEDIPEELAGIDIDKLDYDSDFTVFMKENVPEVLKRQALRQLWRSNPILANVDGLNDYDTDFTDAAMVMKGMQSAYQVGKGYFTAEEEPDPEADVESASASTDAGTQCEASGADGEAAEASQADLDRSANEDDASDDVRTAAGPESPDAGEPDPFEADETEDV